MKTKIRHVDAFIATSRFCKDMHHRMGLNIPIVHLPNFVPSIEAAPPKFEDAFDVNKDNMIVDVFEENGVNDSTLFKEVGKFIRVLD